MAEDESRADDARATSTTFLPQYDAPSFWRLARWGLAACAAVALAIFVCTSDMGMRRIALAYSNSQSSPAPSVTPARDNSEVVRLNETVRRLTVDRDRLLARIDAIERSMADLTGSTSLSFTPPRPATLPPAPESTPPPLAVPANPLAPVVPPSSAVTPPPLSPLASNAPINAPATAPPFAPAGAQDPATPETQAKVEFGVDLGSAPTMEGLRTLWNNAKTRHATLLESLRPVVVIRDGARPGSMELRLVAGPLPSAALAQRMCVVITATGTVCQPAVFDGQRLAMR